MKMYDESLIQEIHNTDRTVKAFGTDVHLKISPTRKADGYMDPFEKEVLAQIASAGQNENNPFEEGLSPELMVQYFRDGTEFANLNLNRMEIITKYEDVEANGHMIGLWRYYLRRGRKEPRPCLIYFHGGAFIAGSVYMTENACRLIAEYADAVVFNVDYDLAPEVKFPGNINECYDVVKHIWEHAEEYGIDRNRITVGGDSAGGNFSAVLCLKDRDEGNHYISQAILLYPAVTFGRYKAEGYTWDIDEFEIAQEDRAIIMTRMILGQPVDLGIGGVEDFYFKDLADASDPYASPMLAESHAGLPKTIIMTAEYDGLRLQGEFYGAQLRKAGVDTTICRYCGCTHEVINRLGYQPQAEETCLTIAEAL